jgi:hypothetical protein
MSAPTSGDEPRGMNHYLDEYQAEIDYRREQMHRDREPFRLWRRAKAATAPRNRAS